MCVVAAASHACCLASVLTLMHPSAVASHAHCLVSVLILMLHSAVATLSLTPSSVVNAMQQDSSPESQPWLPAERLCRSAPMNREGTVKHFNFLKFTCDLSVTCCRMLYGSKLNDAFLWALSFAVPLPVGPVSVTHCSTNTSL